MPQRTLSRPDRHWLRLCAWQVAALSPLPFPASRAALGEALQTSQRLNVGDIREPRTVEAVGLLERVLSCPCHRGGARRNQILAHRPLTFRGKSASFDRLRPLLEV